MALEEDTYAARLRAALDRDGWSQGRLVKELASATGNAVESERSAVRGYLRGSVPRPERARLIAEITGVRELGTVDNPRRSAASRLSDRLESLAADDAEMLQNQLEAMRLLREIHEALGLGGEGGNTAPRQIRR